ncbi:MAG: (d)CMP kinase [Lachnospiraceae bacterium]|nr:(d)CMP kinase [Lachnospiraceae bacterium]
MGFNVAIDGPAGAGKSTIAKRVAKENNFIYVDTGAMYRAIGLFIVRQGIDIHDKEAVEKAAPDAKVSLTYENGEQVVVLNGENVNGLIRTEEVSQAASVTSAYPVVRELLFEMQQTLAKENDVVMDGRDIGTVVLPNAQAKIYLTASVEERARRRFEEYKNKGMDVDIEELKKEIAQRDHQDMTREIAPLKQADDAVLVDSSDMNIDEVTKAIMDIIKERR